MSFILTKEREFICVLIRLMLWGSLDSTIVGGWVDQCNDSNAAKSSASPWTSMVWMWDGSSGEVLVRVSTPGLGMVVWLSF